MGCADWEAKIDLGAIADGVLEVVACNFENRNEARKVPTGSGLKSRVFFAACHGQMLPRPLAFLSLLQASEFAVHS